MKRTIYFSLAFLKIHCISYIRSSSTLQWEYCPHFTGEDSEETVPHLSCLAELGEKSKLSGSLAQCRLMVVTRLLIGKPGTEVDPV